MDSTEHPPWFDSLELATSVAYHVLRWEKGDTERGHGQRADVTEALSIARRAGWDGDEKDFWAAAERMAAFTGALPWHPQRDFLEGEMMRWHKQLSIPQ